MSKSQPQPPRAETADRDLRHVGRSVPRTDASDKVTGRTRYAMDIQPGHLLHAALVTSPHAHARILSIDTGAAEALAGTVAVVTHQDVPDTLRGQGILDRPILPAERVRYIGEPVAVIAAETPELAEEAASLVEAGYEELPAVFDLEEAFSRDPPAVVHEDKEQHAFIGAGDADRSRLVGESTNPDRPNVVHTTAKRVGDVAAGFERADHVVEADYAARPIQHCAMEPHVAVCEVRGEKVKLWTAEQMPHVIEKEICAAYPDIDPSDLTIEAPFVGGGFGGKNSAFLETLLLAVARKAQGRPVRLAFSRGQEFTTAVSRAEAHVSVKDGVSADGDLLAREVEITFDAGAYNEYMFRVTLSSPAAVYSAYDIPNVAYECHEVYTNRPPAGAFRGFGKPQVYWAIERHMDRTARELGIDPLEYRALNLLREGDPNPLGEVLGPNDTEACLRRPAERVRALDVAAEFPEYDGGEWELGRGFAYGVKPIPRSVSTVTVKIQRGMRVVVHVGAPDIGQGSETVLTQMAAEEFDVPMERVTVVAGHTDRTGYDRGPTGSRFTFHAGNALRRASTRAKETLFELAAAELGAGAEELATAEGRVFVRGDPHRAIDVNALFTDYDHPGSVSRTTLREGGELIGTATYDSGGAHACWTPVGQSALVAVNRLTGTVRPLWCCTAVDLGRAINPKTVEQQIEGAAGQGIATALYEEIVYDGGRATNPNFKDYRLPTAAELPHRSESIVLESRDADGPYGAKGIGEVGMMAAAPAVGNAVVDAVSTEFEVIPITPERVLAALEAAEGGTAVVA